MADFILSDIEVDIAGKSNAALLKKTVYFTAIDQIASVPPMDAGLNQISMPIVMQPAVPAGTNTAAVPAGRFAKIVASEMTGDFKVEKLGERDNHAGFKVTVKLFVNGKSAAASYLLSQLRNRRLALIVEERDGTRYLIYDIFLNYSAEVTPKRGYTLDGEAEYSDEPPVYTGPIVL